MLTDKIDNELLDAAGWVDAKTIWHDHRYLHRLAAEGCLDHVRWRRPRGHPGMHGPRGQGRIHPQCPHRRDGMVSVDVHGAV